MISQDIVNFCTLFGYISHSVCDKMRTTLKWIKEKFFLKMPTNFRAISTIIPISKSDVTKPLIFCSMLFSKINFSQFKSANKFGFLPSVPSGRIAPALLIYN